ncbi:DUF348 domain-containing protein [Candidatus Saccharibacteria bacterium]|nr:DUF348 domain-containing protein [Candidatus Saccharibacteria bacterium]
MRVKSLQPASRLFSSMRRLVISEQLRQRFFALLRDHLLAVLFFLAAVSVIVYAATGAMGKTAYDGFYSVSVSHDGRTEELTTSSPTVGELLAELGVDVGELDTVSPAPGTAIDNDGFRIEVLRGRQVRVIDGDSQILGVTVYDEPRLIATELGYELDVNDTASWDEAIAMDSLALVPAVVIDRANDYNLNIDGQVIARKAQATSVGGILEELGHEVVDIAYVRPQLDQTVEEDESIVVYYERPNQEIIIETRRVQEGGVIKSQETVYQIIYDDVTDSVLERNVIEKYTVDQAVADSSIIKSVSTSHRVGDLTAEQQDWLLAAGVDEADWFYVDYIIFRESRWRYWVWNQAGSSAYGLCQALPPVKMRAFGEDYMTNPITQLKWCDWYAHDRYGGWPAAYRFWVNNYWW